MKKYINLAITYPGHHDIEDVVRRCKILRAEDLPEVGEYYENCLVVEVRTLNKSTYQDFEENDKYDAFDILTAGEKYEELTENTEDHNYVAVRRHLRN